MPRRAAPVASLVALIAVGSLALAPARPARADGLYLREAIGGYQVGGELARYYEGDLAVRIGLGYHADGTAVELSMTGGQLLGDGPFAGRHYDVMSWGVRLSRLAPLTSWLALHGHASYLRTSIDADPFFTVEDTRGDAYAGRGLGLGGGLVVHGSMPWIGLLHPALLLVPALRRGPRVSIAAWLDVDQQHVVLHRDRSSSLGGSLGTITLGFTLGGRF